MGMNRRKFKNPERDIESSDGPTYSAFGRKRVPAVRNAILAACDRFEANEEIKRQHGPVKILWKDGKPTEQS